MSVLFLILLQKKILHARELEAISKPGSDHKAVWEATTKPRSDHEAPDSGGDHEASE